MPAEWLSPRRPRSRGGAEGDPLSAQLADLDSPCSGSPLIHSGRPTRPAAPVGLSKAEVAQERRRVRRAVQAASPPAAPAGARVAAPRNQSPERTGRRLSETYLDERRATSRRAGQLPPPPPSARLREPPPAPSEEPRALQVRAEAAESECAALRRRLRSLEAHATAAERERDEALKEADAARQEARRREEGWRREGALARIRGEADGLRQRREEELTARLAQSREESARLRAEVSEADAHAAQLQKQLLSARRQLEEAEAAGAAAQAQHAARATRLDEAEARAATLEAEARECRLMLTRQQGQLDAARQRAALCDELRARLEEANAAGSAAESDRALVSPRRQDAVLLHSLQRRCQDLEAELHDAAVELDATRAQLAEESRRVGRMEAEGQAQRDALRVQLSADADAAAAQRLMRERTAWEASLLELESELQTACARRRWQAHAASAALALATERTRRASCFRVWSHCRDRQRRELAVAERQRVREEVDACLRRELQLQEELDESARRGELLRPRWRRLRSAAARSAELAAEQRLLACRFGAWRQHAGGSRARAAWAQRAAADASAARAAAAARREAALRRNTHGRTLLHCLFAWSRWCAERRAAAAGQGAAQWRQQRLRLGAVAASALLASSQRLTRKRALGSLLALVAAARHGRRLAARRRQLGRAGAGALLRHSCALLLSSCFARWQRWWGMQCAARDQGRMRGEAIRRRRLAASAAEVLRREAAARMVATTLSRWRRWAQQPAQQGELAARIARHRVAAISALRCGAERLLLGRVLGRWLRWLLGRRGARAALRAQQRESRASAARVAVLADGCRARLRAACWTRWQAWRAGCGRAGLAARRALQGRAALGLAAARGRFRAVTGFHAWLRLLLLRRLAAAQFGQQGARALVRRVQEAAVGALAARAALQIRTAAGKGWARWACLRQLAKLSAAGGLERAEQEARIEELERALEEAAGEHSAAAERCEEAEAENKALADRVAKLDRGLAEARDSLSERTAEALRASVDLEQERDRLRGEADEARAEARRWRLEAESGVAAAEDVFRTRLGSVGDDLTRAREAAAAEARRAAGLEQELRAEAAAAEAARSRLAEAFGEVDEARRGRREADERARAAEARREQEGDGLRAQLRRAEGEISELERQVDARAQEQARLAGDLESATAGLAREAERRHWAERAVEELRGSCATDTGALADQNAALQSALDSANAERESLRVRCAALETETASLRGRVRQVARNRELLGRLSDIAQPHEVPEDALSSRGGAQGAAAPAAELAEARAQAAALQDQLRDERARADTALAEAAEARAVQHELLERAQAQAADLNQLRSRLTTEAERAERAESASLELSQSLGSGGEAALRAEQRAKDAERRAERAEAQVKHLTADLVVAKEAEERARQAGMRRQSSGGEPLGEVRRLRREKSAAELKVAALTEELQLARTQPAPPSGEGGAELERLQQQLRAAEAEAQRLGAERAAAQRRAEQLQAQLDRPQLGSPETQLLAAEHTASARADALEQLAETQLRLLQLERGQAQQGQREQRPPAPHSPLCASPSSSPAPGAEDDPHKRQWIFQFADRDRDGYLDYQELKELSEMTGGGLDEEEYHKLLEGLDAPPQGLREEHLGMLYATMPPGSLEHNYNTLRQLHRASPPPSPAPPEPPSPAPPVPLSKQQSAEAARTTQPLPPPDADLSLQSMGQLALDAVSLPDSFAGVPMPLRPSWPPREIPFGTPGALPFKLNHPTKGDPEPIVAVHVAPQTLKAATLRGELKKGDLITAVRTPVGVIKVGRLADFHRAVSPECGVFQGSVVTLIVVHDVKEGALFIKEWKATAAAAARAPPPPARIGSVNSSGSRMSSSAHRKPQRSHPVPEPPKLLVSEVEVRCGPAEKNAEAAEAHLVRLRERIAARRPPLGGSADPEVLRDLLHNPAGRCEQLLREAFAGAPGGARDALAALAGTLGCPPPPPDFIEAAFEKFGVSAGSGQEAAWRAVRDALLSYVLPPDPEQHPPGAQPRSARAQRAAAAPRDSPRTQRKGGAA